jgi:branched-chain amino acid transport system ATP-binding protein/urea transport system ATP-binding protein
VIRVFPELTALENLLVVTTTSFPEAREHALELLRFVKLERLAGEFAGNLSYGQQKLVEFVRVLMTNPELILLDEPAAGMTHDEVARTAELVREINRTHALIVVEHDMQFVKMIARTVTVMHQGAVLVEDTMDRILDNGAVRDVYFGKHGGA